MVPVGLTNGLGPKYEELGTPAILDRAVRGKSMTSWRRAIVFGFLVWLIPFLVAFAAFPLKESWRSLFESIMPLVLAGVVVASAVVYFRRIPAVSFREGIWLGALWLVISVAIDLPLMLSPPLNYTVTEYAADIGLTYLMIPVITAGIARAAQAHARQGKP